MPPGFRERAAFSPVSLWGQDSLGIVYQSSTISASSKPPQGHSTLRRLLFSLYVRKLGGLVSDTPVDHFFGGAAADGAGVGQVLLGEGDAAGGHAGLFLHLQLAVQLAAPHGLDEAAVLGLELLSLLQGEGREGVLLQVLLGPLV